LPCGDRVKTEWRPYGDGARPLGACSGVSVSRAISRDRRQCCRRLDFLSISTGYPAVLFGHVAAAVCQDYAAPEHEGFLLASFCADREKRSEGTNGLQRPQELDHDIGTDPGS